MQVLYAEGPATASQLARRLGESSGATSYHLRALNVGRDGGGGRAAERPRAVVAAAARAHDDPELGSSGASDSERAELQAAHAQIESVFAKRDEQALARWMEIRYDLPLEWQDAQWFGNFRMWATAAEISDFGSSVLQLVEPLRRPPESGDSERMEIHFTFRVLPQSVP